MNAKESQVQRTRPLLRSISVGAVLGLLGACGSGDGAPHLSSVQFEPLFAEAQVYADGFVYGYRDHINVTILGPNGQPLSDTGFLLISGGTVYEGFLSAADIAGGAEPVETPGEFRTDKFGSKRFTVTYALSYLAPSEVTIMEIWSGTAYNRFNVKVACVDPDDSDTIKCSGGGS